MTFWRNVLPNMLLQGQNAVVVVRKTPQNFNQCTVVKIDTYYHIALYATSNSNSLKGGF